MPKGSPAKPPSPSRAVDKKKKQKSNQAVNLQEDIVHAHYEVEFVWPLIGLGTDRTVRSNPFDMCGIPWCLSLKLHDVEDAVLIALHLVNLSDEDIHASYSLTLINHSNPTLSILWEDPEGAICFSSRSAGDNEWGPDEFVTVSTLEDQSEGFLDLYSKFRVSVEVHVQGRLDFNSHEGLSAAIEHATRETELLALANEDLHEIVSKLPVRKNINAQKKQEDKIIFNRTHVKS